MLVELADVALAQKLIGGRDRIAAGETSSSYAERRVDLLEGAARNENFTIGRDIAYAKAALARALRIILADGTSRIRLKIVHYATT